MTIDSSTESHQQHVTSIYKVTPTTPVCCASTRWDAAVISQTHRQSYFDSLKTMKDSLMTTAKTTLYTVNSVSSDPTRGRSIREFPEMDSLDTVKGTTLRMDSLGTVKKGTYRSSIDNRNGQNTRDPSSTLEMHSLQTMKATYSTSMVNTHEENTRDPSWTLLIDSLRTVKGVPFTVHSAYIDQTREQSTRSLSKSSQTDSLRTVNETTDYGASKVQSSIVAVEESEKANNFQGQSHVSSFQVKPSFSSLSPIISPSHTGK